MLVLSIFGNESIDHYMVLARKHKNSYFLATVSKGGELIEYGQWLTNVKIPVHRCALSPDGKLLGIFAYSFRNKGFDTYTAVSRVPYFSAVCFSKAVGTWTGGGGFLSHNLYQVKGGKTSLDVDCNREPEVCKFITGNRKTLPSGLIYHEGGDDTSIAGDIAPDVIEKIRSSLEPFTFRELSE